jgi:hypothetical protein
LDIGNKLNKYLKSTGILNNVFRPQNPKENKNKIIQYTRPPNFFYGSETWTIKARALEECQQ